MNFELYRKMLTYEGETGRERAIARIHRDINQLVIDNPSYKEVFINNEPRHLVVNSTLDAHIKKIQAMPHEPLRVGNHVKYCNNDYWITECSEDDGVYAYGEMTLCNEFVRFISPLDHSTILEYPTILTNTTKFNTGETPNKRITLVSGQFSLLLPINEHTLRVDNDFRFLIDKRKDYPSAYRVTYVDPETYGYGDGMLNIILLQCALNPDTDNIPLMIADYYKDYQEAQETPAISLEEDTPVVKIGMDKTFVPKLSGEIATPLNFEVRMLDEIRPYVAYETDDTKITFHIANDFRLIGNLIEIVISDANGENAFTSMIQIRGVV